jgi:hypothetical protein
MNTPQNYRDIAINPGVWRMIFRTSCIANYRFPALRMAEDQVFLSKICLTEMKTQFTEKQFYKYYVGDPSQLTRSKEALEDLPLAMLEIGIRKVEAGSIQVKFDMFLVARQLVTSLLRARIRVKISALNSFVRICKVNGPVAFMYVLQSVIYLASEKAGLIRHAQK